MHHSFSIILADFVQLCLLAKCYRTALPVIDDEIFEVSTETTGLQPKDMLLYYYYGGRVYVGLKMYKKALEFFKLVSEYREILVDNLFTNILGVHCTSYCAECYHGWSL